MLKIYVPKIKLIGHKFKPKVRKLDHFLGIVNIIMNPHIKSKYALAGGTLPPLTRRLFKIKFCMYSVKSPEIRTL